MSFATLVSLIRFARAVLFPSLYGFRITQARLTSNQGSLPEVAGDAALQVNLRCRRSVLGEGEFRARVEFCSQDRDVEGVETRDVDPRNLGVHGDAWCRDRLWSHPAGRGVVRASLVTCTNTVAGGAELGSDKGAPRASGSGSICNPCTIDIDADSRADACARGKMQAALFNDEAYDARQRALYAKVSVSTET